MIWRISISFLDAVSSKRLPISHYRHMRTGARGPKLQRFHD